MGIDCGFDMVPPLSASDSDQARWQAFLHKVKEAYVEDPAVKMERYYINFEVGEHPKLPYQAQRFLSFRSKISGSSTASPYIRLVFQLAKSIFGERVQFWHEGSENYGYHNWKEVMDSLKSYSDPNDSIAENSIPPNGSTDKISPVLFNETFIQGKGQGLVASRNIPKGTRILSEKYIFRVPRKGVSEEEVNKLIAKKLSQLSKTDQRAFFELHNNYKGSKGPFLGIAKTNALPLGPDASEGGLFLKASRINHDCFPNCQHTWNERIGKETIHAVRDIAQYEEITISYSDTCPSRTRKDRLKETFGFDCTCHLCSLPEEKLKNNNERLRKIQQLDEEIGDGMHLVRQPLGHLRLVHSLVSLLKAENICDARLPRAYYDAFQTVIAHGDQARASVFANRAYMARSTCEGEDSPSTIYMKSLAENPQAHRLFETTRKWFQKKQQIPKNLNEEAFEKWLWKVKS